MRSKRDFIKGCAGIVSGGSIVGTASGDSGGLGARENLADRDPVVSHLQQGNYENAKKLLDEGDNAYSISAVRMGDETTSSGDKGCINPSISSGVMYDWFDRSASEIYLTVFDSPELESDERYVYLSWSAKVVNNPNPDKPAPPDVAGIAWEDSQFGYVNGSMGHNGWNFYGPTGTFDDYEAKTDREAPISVVSEPIIDDPLNAAVIKIRDGEVLNWWEHSGWESWHTVMTSGDLWLTLRKQDNSEGHISGKYEHTWGAFDAGNWNIFESISLSKGAVGISIDLPSGTDSWDATPSEDW